MPDRVVVDEVLKNLASLSGLEMLNLEGCDQFNDSGLRLAIPSASYRTNQQHDAPDNGDN
jgi:hypothetical protein